eukprot:CAMPEP_0180522052 /NCGR_PEP_ID=MMETSP1036_2-20121128/57195_1 /TAXON_ID=632150 /ORGANISM="Azadinium spinosum, Strain 3D9" /LENGTH=380 /DNA_ID=CAMNT_0022534791 /DNA_START=72 /DNA_END=1211 /DNA_ORIENTATION=-
MSKTALAALVKSAPSNPVTFKAMNTNCQLRPGPNHDFSAIGLLRKGTTFRGFPIAVTGEVWIKLHDMEAATYVPEKAKREDGVWLPQVHPKHGKLVQNQEEVERYGASSSTTASDASQDGERIAEGSAFGKTVELTVNGSFEEVLMLQWSYRRCELQPGEILAMRHTDSVIEMVIDTQSGRTPTTAKDINSNLMVPGKRYQPAKGAVVKRVPADTDLNSTVSNMPDGRYFLISVVVTFDKRHRLRSPWTRAATLNKDGRDKVLGNCDPVGQSRGKCEGKGCSCPDFVPFGGWTMNSDPVVRCRRCACIAELHMNMGMLEPTQVKTKGEAKVKAPEPVGEPLPREARSWDKREKNLWFWSNGALHPRENPHAARKREDRPG